MPIYRVFPLDFEGNTIGPGQHLQRESDHDAREFGCLVQAAGGYIEIWRDTTRVLSSAAVPKWVAL